MVPDQNCAHFLRVCLGITKSHFAQGATMTHLRSFTPCSSSSKCCPPAAAGRTRYRFVPTPSKNNPACPQKPHVSISHFRRQTHQVGGMYPGLKVCRSPAALPLQVATEPLTISEDVIAKLNQHLVLCYSGQARLARNLLQGVLRCVSSSCGPHQSVR